MKTMQINTKIYYSQGLEELILLKCSYFAKQSIDTKQSLSQYQVMSFFYGLEQIILKFAWDC